MTPRARKFFLTTHVTVSVGWLGAVLAYIALAAMALHGAEIEPARAAYLSMEAIGWLVLVPLSALALLTGLVQSLGTEWGLFRHYWVATKFVLITGATAILLGHMRAVERMATAAADPGWSIGDHGTLRVQLVVHAAGGLLVLLVATVLSIYKPWGKTPYGRRAR